MGTDGQTDGERDGQTDGEMGGVQRLKRPRRGPHNTRSQAVARIADRTASQQTLVISDCC